MQTLASTFLKPLRDLARDGIKLTRRIGRAVVEITIRVIFPR